MIKTKLKKINDYIMLKQYSLCVISVIIHAICLISLVLFYPYTFAVDFFLKSGLILFVLGWLAPVIAFIFIFLDMKMYFFEYKRFTVLRFYILSLFYAEVIDFFININIVIRFMFFSNNHSKEYFYSLAFIPFSLFCIGMRCIFKVIYDKYLKKDK